MRVWETKDLHIKLPKEFGMGMEFLLDYFLAYRHPNKARGKQKEQLPIVARDHVQQDSAMTNLQESEHQVTKTLPSQVDRTETASDLPEECQPELPLSLHKHPEASAHQSYITC